MSSHAKSRLKAGLVVGSLRHLRLRAVEPPQRHGRSAGKKTSDKEPSIEVLFSPKAGGVRTG